MSTKLDLQRILEVTLGVKKYISIIKRLQKKTNEAIITDTENRTRKTNKTHQNESNQNTAININFKC